MIVLKFGGAVLKEPEALQGVSSIVASRLDQKPVVVVSAFGDTTDKLSAIMDALSAGHGDEARRLVSDIEDYHVALVQEAFPGALQGDQALEVLGTGIAELKRLVDGMDSLREVSPRSRDALLSFGELASVPLLSLFLISRGLPAEMVDPRNIIITDQHFGKASPAAGETERKCREVILPLLEAGKVPITGGFVGATLEAVVTTLGRGGSDFTASLIASFLGASTLEYWKDVDGILTADPTLVPEAKTVSLLTFREAAELAFLGARVLHPASIQPALDAGVPVRVLNFFRPESPGTLISDAPLDVHGGEGPPERAVTSIACKRDQVLLGIYSTRMLGASGFLRRVFEVFDRLSLSVDHIATSEVSVTVTLAPTELTEEIKKDLGEIADVEVELGIGVVSVVGEMLSDTPGVAAKVFSALQDHNIKLVTYGGSGVNLSLVVRDDEVPRAVQSLHRELCAEPRMSH